MCWSGLCLIDMCLSRVVNPEEEERTTLKTTSVNSSSRRKAKVDSDGHDAQPCLRINSAVQNMPKSSKCWVTAVLKHNVSMVSNV